MKLFLLISFLFFRAPFGFGASLKTSVGSSAAKAKLLGKHGLRLQWLNESATQVSPPGEAWVREEDGLLKLKGRQDRRVFSGKGQGDFLEVDGVITQVDEKSFKFKGSINSQVYFLCEGREARREGEFDFRVTGGRKFWRLKQQERNCGEGDDSVDYVDLLF